MITLTAFPHQTIIKSGTSDYIPIAILSRKFSPSFCIYIQTGLNLFPSAAKYVPGEKEKAAFPFSPVSRLVAMVVGGGNGRMPTVILPLPKILLRTFPNRSVCFSDSFRTFGGMEVRIYAPYGIINISENFSKDEIQKRDNKSFRTKQFDARREKIQVLFF